MENFNAKTVIADMFEKSNAPTFMESVVETARNLTDKQVVTLKEAVAKHVADNSGDSGVKTKANRIIGLVSAPDLAAPLKERMTAHFKKGDDDDFVPLKGSAISAMYKILGKVAEGVDAEKAEADVLASPEFGEQDRKKYANRRIAELRTEMLTWVRVAFDEGEEDSHVEQETAEFFRETLR